MKKNSDRLYIRQMLMDIAQEVYNDMYGGWKQVYAENGCIPTKSEFLAEILKLLPEKYMTTTHGTHPNKMCKAIECKETDTAKEIMAQSQTWTIAKIANHAEMECKTLKSRIGIMLQIAGVTEMPEQLPIWLKDSIVNWAKNDVKKIGVRRIGDYISDTSPQKSIFTLINCSDDIKVLNDAVEIVKKILLFQCDSQKEYEKKVKEITSTEHVKIITKCAEAIS